MLELGFISTNRAKLAHFSYLGREAGINVFNFRERTFHASYTEPRALDRKELLQLSYESALKQWKKGHFSEEDFFFIEDTSVILHALSKRGREVPGVDVKYWMQDKTFESLDFELKLHGNDRRVTVRSDIILHVPPKIRAAVGMNAPYLWVFGASEGTIISKERSLKTNPLNPWLDNKSFNKWFVPAGQTLPISSLTLRQSLLHDFRRKAFDQVVDFFRQLHMVPAHTIAHRTQIALPSVVNHPPTFIVCGFSCSGKTTLAEFLVNEYGYMHFEASDFMRVAYHERLGNEPERSLADFAKLILKREPWVVPERIISLMQKISNSPFVITGFRAPAEVKEFSERWCASTPVEYIFVDADFEKRYKRSLVRKRKDAPGSFSEMRQRDKDQMAMGLSRIKMNSEFKILQNKSTIKLYYQRFRSKYGRGIEFLKKRKIVPQLSHFGGLEQIVLRALRECWEAGEYFTTTEISHFINSRGYSSFGVAKDNVSRYFSQRYSPYFEFVLQGKKRKFRLSQTGLAFEKLLRAQSVEARQHSLGLNVGSMRQQLPF